MVYSSATPRLKLLDCSCLTSPITRFNPCPSICLTHINFIPSSFSLQSKSKITPFAAQTSNWAQQEDKTELGHESDEVNEAEYSFVEEAKLFVGNLHYDVDSEKLAQLFNQAGVVEISEVIYNRQTDRSRGFGFVTMSSVEEAEKAVEMFNRYELNGRLLTVNKASPVVSQPERVPKLHEAAFRIYIGNLPWQVDNARLEKVFSEHGKVIDARVVCDRDTGRSRGFGFVTMSTETEVNDAITALDGLNLDGRAIRVNIAEERPRRSF